MEPIVSSETSAIRTQTPGNYPKRNKLHLEHGESIKTRFPNLFSFTQEFYFPVSSSVHKYRLHKNVQVTGITGQSRKLLRHQGVELLLYHTAVFGSV